jgi:hypothetical protein
VTLEGHGGNARRRSPRAGLAASAVASLAGLVACVDSGRANSPDAAVPPGSVQPITCTATPRTPYAGDAGIPSAAPTAGAPYVWKNAVIKGGGFVSGIIMSPALPGLAFARTDVGGAYRYDASNQSWTPLTDWVGNSNAGLMGIESIAVDPVDPNRVYVAAGQYLTAGYGTILSSTDMGQTWVQNNISAYMGGNADGRSMGERLAVDPNLPTTLYFGSRNQGLFSSTNSGQTWSQNSGFPTCGTTNGCTNSGNNSAGTGYGLTFVLFDPSSGSPDSATPTIYVGVGMLTGSNLYRSTDAGATWTAVAGQPTGMMPHHAVFDGCGDIYLTYNNGSGPNSVTDGAVWRYTPATGTWADVSPTPKQGGFGGISADPAHPGTLLVTTIDDWSNGEIYRTTDGLHWKELGGPANWDVAGAQWLYWHGSNLPARGWMGDVEIDPFDSTHALFITGQGLWSTNDLTAADSESATTWSFSDDGLEETVVLDLASPPPIPPATTSSLLSGVGDIGGFLHDDLDVSPSGGMSYNPLFGNTTSIDFGEKSNPLVVARVGTASSNPKQTGGYSMDGGNNWTAFPMLPAATGSSTPSSGSIAVSADGGTFVWVPKGGTPSYTQNQGAKWTASTGLAAGSLVAADRVNPSKFYATTQSAFYASTDGGQTFTKLSLPSTIASTGFGRPRPVFGIEGDVWVTTKTSLLHAQGSGATWQAISGVGGASAVGFGMSATAGGYPAVYLAANLTLVGATTAAWGIYRSDDMGMTWRHIDDAQHEFGFIGYLAGDQTRPGRVYLGTSGRGIVYGDPQ